MDTVNPYEIDGQGSKVFAELGVEACLNYDTLKAALLLAYERVPEFHRKRFRTLNKFGNETYSTFAFRLALPFNSWMDGEEALFTCDLAVRHRLREEHKRCSSINQDKDDMAEKV